MPHESSRDDPRPLDERERRELDRIERALLVDEPRLSARLDRHLDADRSRRRWTWAAAGGAFAGLAATATGVVADAGLLGVAGFALTVAAVDVLADHPALRERIGVISARLRTAIGVAPRDD